MKIAILIYILEIATFKKLAIFCFCADNTPKILFYFKKLW